MQTFRKKVCTSLPPDVVCVHCTQLGKLATFQLQPFSELQLSTDTLHKQNPVAMLRAWCAIVRCQSRSGRWTSWPGAPSIRHQEPGSCAVTPTESMYTNFRDVPYQVFQVGVYTLAVPRWSIRKVCRRSRVQTWFAPFLNPDLGWYILAHTGINKHKPVYTSRYRYMLVCAGICWYVLACAVIEKYVPVCICTYFYYLVCIGTYWYTLVYTRIYVYTSMYCAFRHWTFFEILKWIQHDTRQFKEVPKGPVPLNKEVQGGTSLVLSCSFRDTGHLGTVLILQCTAWYSVVSTNKLKRRFCI
jgi:hypothetical protein